VAKNAKDFDAKALFELTAAVFAKYAVCVLSERLPVHLRGGPPTCTGVFSQVRNPRQRKLEVPHVRFSHDP